MIKKYLYLTLFTLLLSASIRAQDEKDSSFGAKSQEQPFDNLSIYPNPVGNGRIYITSKSSSPKDIEVFDVLGKRVLVTTIVTKELNVGALTPGVYIIKIKEADLRATRKLIIK